MPLRPITINATTTVTNRGREIPMAVRPCCYSGVFYSTLGFLYMKSIHKINRVYHKGSPKSNRYHVYWPPRGSQGSYPQGFHLSRGLRTLAEWSVVNPSTREHSRAPHQYWSGSINCPVVINQGFGVSGTSSGSSVAINGPVSRVRSISGELCSSASSASLIVVMRGCSSARIENISPPVPSKVHLW